MDESLGREIAAAYEQMPDEPNAARVQASYRVFVQEVRVQYDQLARAVLIEFVDVDPYPDSKSMFADLDRGTLKVYTGGNPNLLITDHENVLFRAVHDYFGHYLGRNGFGPKGEYAAWQRHREMFSPLARGALATETIGQSTWFFFSESNQDKPYPKRQFAIQKAGLLPERYW